MMADKTSKQISSENSNLAAAGDRRRAPREDVRLSLEVGESRHATAATDQESVAAWGSGQTRNISDDGICFLSPMRLRPGSIRVREAGEAPDPETNVELEIVRCRKISDRLWEYGAALRAGEGAATYELPSGEFESLYSALRNRSQSSGATQSCKRDTAQKDSTTEARQLVLSLREVAQWQIEMERYSEYSDRRRTSLSVAKAVVMFTAVFLIAQSVWTGDVAMWWGPALAAAVTLIYVEERRLERRFQELCAWSPTQQPRPEPDPPATKEINPPGPA